MCPSRYRVSAGAADAKRAVVEDAGVVDSYSKVIPAFQQMTGKTWP
jgi:hypothetical protein